MAIDYDAWAKKYDDTRGASPSVVRPILEALGPADGRSLVDIGGGTGNFARPLIDAGFRVTVADYSREMARRAAAKLPDGELVAVADAQSLPFRDGAFDCAVSVNVLRHVPDWRLGLREMRRVLRDGPLVLKVSTRETAMANWVFGHYFKQTIDETMPAYETAESYAAAMRGAGFATVDVSPVHYTDTLDGSFQALTAQPELFLDDERVRNTAVVMRTPEPERTAIIERIRADYASGRLWDVIAEYEPLVRQHGGGYVFRAGTGR